MIFKCFLMMNKIKISKHFTKYAKLYQHTCRAKIIYNGSNLRWSIKCILCTLNVLGAKIERKTFVKSFKGVSRVGDRMSSIFGFLLGRILLTFNEICRKTSSISGPNSKYEILATPLKSSSYCISLFTKFVVFTCSFYHKYT